MVRRLLNHLLLNCPLIIRAAETGNDQLIDFLMSCSLADADHPPIPGETVSSSTPMLAAIGRENIKVIEVLLKQKNFNPTRQFYGLTYYEIAERRRGLVWEDEVRLLKQAFSSTSEPQNRSPNNAEQVVPKVVANSPYLNPSSLSGENINDIGPQSCLYDCTWCRYSFSHESHLKVHQEKCFARPFSVNVKPDLTHEKIAMHSGLQPSSLIRPIRPPVQPMSIAQSCTVSRTVSDLAVSPPINQVRCHSASPQSPSKITDVNMGPLDDSLRSGGSPISSTLVNSGNFREDHGAIGLPVDRNCLMEYPREKLQASEGYNAPEHPKIDSMTDSSTPQITESSARHTSEITSPFTIPSQGESEVSEFSMNESSEDSHCEEESLFVQRAERRRTLLRGLMDMVYTTYICLASSGAMVDGESGPSNAPRGGSGFASSSHNRKNMDHDAKGKRPLPRGDGDDDGEEGDDQQQPKRRKSAAYSNGNSPAERFACPYYQRNCHRHLPRNYSLKGACYGPGFHSVHRVK
ncbi:hypothetical protein F4814DRAFT_438784 [Daldinia grandis]|nr:hypothetical protein F4814DRAFT_438784 [Daldinia grandis]